MATRMYTTDLSPGSVERPPTPYQTGIALMGQVNIAGANLREQRKENALLRQVINEQRTALMESGQRLAAEKDAVARANKRAFDSRYEQDQLRNESFCLRDKINAKQKALDHSKDREAIQSRTSALLVIENKRLVGRVDHLVKANATLRTQASERRVEMVGLREQLREQGKRCASTGESQSYVMLCDERKVTACLHKTVEGYRRKNEGLRNTVANRDLAIQDATKRVRWLEGCQDRQAKTIAKMVSESAGSPWHSGVTPVVRLEEELRVARVANSRLLGQVRSQAIMIAEKGRTIQERGTKLSAALGEAGAACAAVRDLKCRVQLLDALVAERDGTIQDRRKKIQATQDEVVALNRTVKDLKRLLSTKDKTIADREARRRMLCGEIAIYKKDRDKAQADAYDWRVARDFAQSALASEIKASSQLGDMVTSMSAKLDSHVAEEERKLESEWNMTTTSRREQ